MKYFIIRLKNNSISEKYAVECVNQAKHFGINIEYFDAVNGLEYQQHLDKLKINPKYKFKKGRAGVFGCFLSHYYLWKQCSADNIPYVILEHDGYVIKPFPSDILNYFEESFHIVTKVGDKGGKFLEIILICLGAFPTGPLGFYHNPVPGSFTQYPMLN